MDRPQRHDFGVQRNGLIIEPCVRNHPPIEIAIVQRPIERELRIAKIAFIERPLGDRARGGQVEAPLRSRDAGADIRAPRNALRDRGKLSDLQVRREVGLLGTQRTGRRKVELFAIDAEVLGRDSGFVAREATSQRGVANQLIHCADAGRDALRGTIQRQIERAGNRCDTPIRRELQRAGKVASRQCGEWLERRDINLASPLEGEAVDHAVEHRPNRRQRQNRRLDPRWLLRAVDAGYVEAQRFAERLCEGFTLSGKVGRIPVQREGDGTLGRVVRVFDHPVAAERDVPHPHAARVERGNVHIGIPTPLPTGVVVHIDLRAANARAARQFRNAIARHDRSVEIEQLQEPIGRRAELASERDLTGLDRDVLDGQTPAFALQRGQVER